MNPRDLAKRSFVGMLAALVVLLSGNPSSPKMRAAARRRTAPPVRLASTPSAWKGRARTRCTACARSR